MLQVRRHTRSTDFVALYQSSRARLPSQMMWKRSEEKVWAMLTLSPRWAWTDWHDSFPKAKAVGLCLFSPIRGFGKDFVSPFACLSWDDLDLAGWALLELRGVLGCHCKILIAALMAGFNF